MYKPAFSIIEVVITIALLALALLWFIPTQSHLNHHIALQQEIDQFRRFFYRLQNRASLFRQHYSLTLSQRDGKWCLIAAKKRNQQIKCDCLQPTQCLSSEFFIYQPLFPEISVRSNSLYPHIFLELSGDSGNSSVKCLQFVAGQSQRILKFERGLVSEYPEKNRSKCNDI